MAGHVKYRRESGRWRARYPNPAKGGTAQIERTFRTKREAEDWLVQQQASVLTGSHVAPHEGTRRFADVYGVWCETRWPGLQPATTARYGQIWRKYLQPEFGERKLASITREQVRRYFAQLPAATGARAGTVRKVHAVMSAILNEAVELGYLKMNPCTGGVRGLPQSANQEMLFLTAAEVQTLAEAVKPWYRVLVYTAAYTGLRASELAGLRWRNLDLLHGKLTVSEGLKDIGGRLVVGPPTTHERRTLSLPRFLCEMLTEHLASLPGERGPEDFVFPAQQGGPMRDHLFYRRHFKPAVRRALPDKRGLRFHDLRHTCASLLIAQGAHPKLIQARLGHSSIQITLDRYGHLFPSVDEVLAAKLDAAFEASQPNASVAVP